MIHQHKPVTGSSPTIELLLIEVKVVLDLNLRIHSPLVLLVGMTVSTQAMAEIMDFAGSGQQLLPHAESMARILLMAALALTRLIILLVQMASMIHSGKHSDVWKVAGVDSPYLWLRDVMHRNLNAFPAISIDLTQYGITCSRSYVVSS